jgi:hypothetical protein
MSLLMRAKSGVESAGKFLAGTGKGALKKIGEGARSIKKLGGEINTVTGGMAGTAFEASQSMPVIGAVTRNVEKGLDMAEKYSGLGVKAIDLGERASKVRDMKGAKGVYQEAQGLARSARR